MGDNNMGGYITIGFVFRSDKLALNAGMIKYLVDRFKLSDFSFLLNNEKAILYRDMNEEIYQLIIANDYGNILLMSDFLDVKNQMINIVYIKFPDYFSIQIQLFNNPLRKLNYDDYELKLIDYIKTSYPQVPFAYAMCGCDSEIDFSPNEIDDEDFNYSILVVPEGNDFIIKQGECRIDGNKR
jgi:hypothetical protein